MKVLVCVDGTEASHKALQRALQLAKADDEVVFCHACAYYDQIELDSLFGVVSYIDPHVYAQHRKGQKARGQLITDAYVQKCQEAGRDKCSAVVLEAGQGEKEVLDFAKHNNVDMIVVGHSDDSVFKVLAGSFADHIVKHATCAVVVAK